MKKLLLIATGVVAILAGTGVALANPSIFLYNTPTSISTTTPSYMTPGTGTTTLTFDSFANGPQVRVTDKAALLTQFVASSTSSILAINIQYSQDGIDWYSDNINQPSTTTIVSDISVANSYKWTAQGTATSSKAIVIQTPTRYFRVVYSITGAGGGVYGQFIPQRQTQ